MSRYEFYGSDGFLRDVLPAFRRQLKDPSADIVLVDDDTKKLGNVVDGCPVISFEDLCQSSEQDRLVNVSIANPQIRRRLVRRCEEHGFHFFSVEDVSHIRYAHNVIGEGAILCGQSMFTSNTTVGAHFHLNIYQ